MRRRALLVLAGALAGAILAAAYTFLVRDPTYRADATVVLVREGQPPGSDPRLAAAAAAAAELFESRAVAESVVANLRLDDSPEGLLDRVRVAADPETSLVRVTVDAPARDEARRVAQAVTEVATVLYNDRFGPGTNASVWETPRAGEDPVAPDEGLNLVLGALAGAALARLAFLAAARPARRPARDTESQPPPPAPAAIIPAAEPAVAAAAPEPARDTVAQASPATPEPEPEPEPVRAPQAPPEPEPARPFVEPRLGEWTVGDVESLLAEHGSAFPERLDELRVYLESFRDVAGPGGALPDGVEGIVEDVFGQLLDRARLTSPA